MLSDYHVISLKTKGSLSLAFVNLVPRAFLSRALHLAEESPGNEVVAFVADLTSHTRYVCHRLRFYASS